MSGDAAKNIQSMPEKMIVDSFLKQLDAMFGNQQDSNPATRHYLEYFIFDWAKMPFVRAGYSYPAIGGMGQRGELAKVWSLVRRCYFYSSQKSTKVP